MEREGFTIPLLIGGATTSRVHTAVKIEPKYHGPTVHVIDASRAVGVAGNLRSDSLRPEFVAAIKAEYQDVRTQRGGRQAQERRQSITDARGNRLKIDWSATPVPRPCSTGIRALPDFPLEELVPLIDWTPFFQTWELAGHYPAILTDPVLGTAATNLFRDANQLLQRIVRERLFQARGVFGIFPANSVGDDIELYADEARDQVRTVFHTLRQQMVKPPGRPNLALADFVAPKQSSVADYVGAFAVTAGHGVDALVARFEAEHDDYNAILAKALADRLAEAFAELLHQRVRKEFWGYARDESLAPGDLIKERFQGIRPAPGYPACPDHTEKRIVFDLLQAEKETGITLTESYAMLPTASVSGYYFWRPEAQYFGLGKIERDQVADYAGRKGTDVPTIERWLSPNLNYDR
jgi:5-methyltetrahydrofolate--homocysteine methyltransferase